MFTKSVIIALCCLQCFDIYASNNAASETQTTEDDKENVDWQFLGSNDNSGKEVNEKIFALLKKIHEADKENAKNNNERIKNIEEKLAELSNKIDTILMNANIQTTQQENNTPENIQQKGGNNVVDRQEAASEQEAIV